MRGPLLAVTGALARGLGLAAPARAQQARDPLAALAVAGAPISPADVAMDVTEVHP